MTPMDVTGIGVWLAEGGDRRDALDAWYQGNELAMLPGTTWSEALRGAAARALHNAGIRSRSAFEWVAVGSLPDDDAYEIDRVVDTVWDALAWAREALVNGDVAAVLITEVGELGAGALVLASQAAANGPRYATLGGLGLWDAERQVEDVRAGIRRAMTEAGITPASVMYLEYVGEDRIGIDQPAVGGLLDAYRLPECFLSCALSAGSPATGAVLAVIKTVVALNQRFIPAVIDRPWEDPDHWIESSFYAVARSKPWFRERGKRIAVVHGAGATSGSQGGHLVLSESTQRVAVEPAISRVAHVLIPLRAASREGFERRLDALGAQLGAVESPVDLRDVARQAYGSYRVGEDAPYAMALVGEGREGLIREIAYAREGMAQVFERGEVWQSPRGSTLTLNPLGGEGRVAFVYPGAFNAYLDLGRDLFYLFPFLYERLGHVVSHIGRSVQDRALYPRSLEPLTKDEKRSREAALLADPPALIEAGTSFAVLFTAILREAFGVHPHSALGYSLGEVSMLWALGVWEDGDRGLRAWRSSPLFKTQLSGSKRLVRERWKIPPHVDDGAIWATYVLKAPVDRVRRVVESRSRVEIMLVNAPGEVVIGGDPDACYETIETLDVHALPVPYDAVIHSSLMASLRPDFASLYEYPVCPVPETTFYSAANYERLTLQSGALARSLARMTCAPVDFTRLIDRVYQDGARIFVEVGPQRTCTRWIGKILGDRPHAALAIDRKNAPDALSILGVLAGLVSHQVPLDLSLLYHEEPTPVLSLPDVVPHAEAAAATGRQQTPAAAPVLSAASNLSRTIGQMAHDHMLRDVAIHRSFLGVRQIGMQDLSALIHTQMSAYGQLVGGSSAGTRVQFDEDAIRAFATGSPTACFGALFEPFEGRRVPRIPNGSFRFLNRVLDVDGPLGEIVVGRTLVAECEVEPSAWFVLPDGSVPDAVLMEMGMQPCGFLSAYMGSTRHHVDTDFYFRNLDGEGMLLRAVDLRGRTVTTRTRLRGSTAVGNAIVQTFDFALACGGVDFYAGEATFGYFTRKTLADRAGLDGGEAIKPWLQRSPDLKGRRVELSCDRMPARLTFLQDLQVVDGGGDYLLGYAHAVLDVSPDAWFFARHFYEDPVMPGSLGVEAMRAALGGCVYAQLAPLGTSLPVLRTPVGARMGWRYRGQILPADLSDGTPLHLEVHVIEQEIDAFRVRTWGEGSLWKGKLRIYEVKDLAVEFALPEES